MRILRLLTIAVVIQIWTGAVIYAHGQTVPTEVKQAMIASISASNMPAGGAAYAAEKTWQMERLKHYLFCCKNGTRP